MIQPGLGQYEGDNDRLGAMRPRFRLKRFCLRELNAVPLRGTVVEWF